MWVFLSRTPADNAPVALKPITIVCIGNLPTFGAQYGQHLQTHQGTVIGTPAPMPPTTNKDNRIGWQLPSRIM